jgi:hypothetical protein
MKMINKFILGFGFFLLTPIVKGEIDFISISNLLFMPIAVNGGTNFISASNETLECHLNGLFTGEGLDCIWTSVKENKAVLAVTFHGQDAKTNNWIIGSLESISTGGNVLHAGSISWSQDFNKVILIWSPTLPQREIWELHLLAKRTADSGFATNEIATFKNIVVLKPDVPIQLTNQVNVNGVTLKLKQFTLSTKLDALGKTWSELKMMVSGLTNDVFLDSIGATDDYGNEYLASRQDGNFGVSGQPEISFWVRELSPKVKSVNFTFAVQHGRAFTFHAKPQIISTNIPWLMDVLRMKQFN